VFLFISPVDILGLVLRSKKFLKEKKLAASVEFKQSCMITNELFQFRLSLIINNYSKLLVMPVLPFQ
jgi:hypothetical protein